MNEIKELLKQRGQEYGQAWLMSGAIERAFKVRFFPLFKESDFGYVWSIILNKLCRALVSPHKLDTWRDIAGYAELVAQALQEAESVDQ